MLEPEEELKKLSFDEEVYHVLRTPNRLKSGASQFEGWSDLRQYPQQTPSSKPTKKPLNLIFKIKPHQQKNTPQLIKGQHSTIKYQNKENHLSECQKFINMKVFQFIDEQISSSNSRKILTPNRIKSIDRESKTKRRFAQSKETNSKVCETPKSTRRIKQDVSLNKLCSTERVGSSNWNKICHSQKKINPDKPKEQQCVLVDSKIEAKNEFKIPLSAILYPMLKSTLKRQPRRIERFHSFIARTVRK